MVVPVDISVPDDEYVEGDTIPVTATVENTTGESRMVDVEYYFDGELHDERDDIGIDIGSTLDIEGEVEATHGGDGIEICIEVSDSPVTFF